MRKRTNRYLLSAIVFAIAANMVACDKKGKGEGYKVPDDGLGVAETMNPEDSLQSYEYDEVGKLIKPTDEDSKSESGDKSESSSRDDSSVENSTSVDSENSSIENSSGDETSEPSETETTDTIESGSDNSESSTISSPYDVKISNVIIPDGSDLVLSNEMLVFTNTEEVLYDMTVGVSSNNGEVSNVIVTDVYVNASAAIFQQSYSNPNLSVTILKPSGESYGDGCYSITLDMIYTTTDGATVTVEDLKFETDRR